MKIEVRREGNNLFFISDVGVSVVLLRDGALEASLLAVRIANAIKTLVEVNERVTETA